MVGASVVAFASAPAEAAIIAPSASHQISVALDGRGNPIPFTLEASGYQAGEPVYVEVCDGESATTAGWSPTSDCDETTSGAAVQADSKGRVTFPVGGQSEVLIFRGASPDDRFNCLAAADIKKGATPRSGMGNVVPLGRAAYPPAGDAGYNSYEPKPQAAAAGLPSWDNCQLRIASTDETATTDQQFVTLHLGGATLVSTTTKKSGSSNWFTTAAPIAAVVLIVGGGLLYFRRRRTLA